MFQLFVYVPESHLEEVKAAMFAAGAGRSQRYEQCSWQVLGQGQFLPLEGSEPYIGQVKEVARIPEYRLEMICGEVELPQVISAMKQAHPYEEPAYGAFLLLRV
jgi:Uncharacterized protein conserved in bacteria